MKVKPHHVYLEGFEPYPAKLINLVADENAAAKAALKDHPSFAFSLMRISDHPQAQEFEKSLDWDAIRNAFRKAARAHGCSLPSGLFDVHFRHQDNGILFNVTAKSN